MKLSIVSNAPWAPTGYGTQTAQLSRRLKADGHDVAILANYGSMGQMADWEGIPVYPGGTYSHGQDVLRHQHREHLDGEPGWVITLYDVWVYGDSLEGINVAAWIPIDHVPVPPLVLQWAEKQKRLIAMSKFGHEALDKVGVASTYVPLAIDSEVYRPRPSDVRQRIGIPDDAFLVMVNGANQGIEPNHKAWPEMLMAMTVFMSKHPDVWLYLHTDVVRPSGLHLPGLMHLLDVPADRVRAPNRITYNTGGIPAEVVAESYTAADVLLCTSAFEGFGLAVTEAMACGTPAIVTDFSAQPELVGDTGWKVGRQYHYDAAQGAMVATPHVDKILVALEESYAEWRTEDAQVRSAAAMAKAAEYDADAVFDTHWRPLLADMERDLTPNRATRRQRKLVAVQ